MHSDLPVTTASFRELALPPFLLKTLDEVGYETPSPIQSEAIPSLLEGRDLLGHAPTGTGKTAAFALPLLARLESGRDGVQIMVLTPTRELAIQVAEAFKSYGRHLDGFRVSPIYGGQDYGAQIRRLEQGVQVVVGTPGRVMDLMRKGALRLDGLRALVLDEADEMLRMGFIDDVEWVLGRIPGDRQIALFSATMPRAIEAIARRHLSDPCEVSIRSRPAGAETIRQRYWLVEGMGKDEALFRILEVESFDAVIVFVRTKTATVELAERLEARGHAVAALNGDIVQRQREQIVERLRHGGLDVVVATDVAARGLDVERISLVVNYDVPYDAETYVHRIGRTGRAGRRGDALLFVTPRERRMLKTIERATRQPVEPLEAPSSRIVNDRRIAAFEKAIGDTLATEGLDVMRGIVEQYRREHDVPEIEIAAALARLALDARGGLLPPDRPAKTRPRTVSRRRESGGGRSRGSREQALERYRLEVGHAHGVRPGHIVGAIANEAGLDARHIGHIDIQAGHSLVDLPEGMPDEVFADLGRARVCGRPLRISRLGRAAERDGRRRSGRRASERRGRRH